MSNFSPLEEEVIGVTPSRDRAELPQCQSMEQFSRTNRDNKVFSYNVRVQQADLSSCLLTLGVLLVHREVQLRDQVTASLEL